MSKRKILVAAMALCVCAILVAGGTLAYFTDTDSAKNVFTSGNVNIDLTEAVVEPNANGDLVAVDKENNRQDVEENEEIAYDYGRVYPGQYIEKDPTIENLGTEDVYMAAIVTITSQGDLHSVIGSEISDYINAATPVELARGGESVQAIAGGLAGQHADWVADWHGFGAFECAEGVKFHSIQQVKANADGAASYVLYFFIDEVQQPQDKVTLFERINFDWEWNNEQMDAFKGLGIQIEAYAVQAYGFTDTAAGDDCYVAITAAFPEAFADVIK